MSNSEDNNISKSNGLGADPMQRLASLKTPRDLSLGGIKPNKKVFIPNLNVARNKNKGPATVNSRDTKDNKGRKDRKNDRNNKNFNKNGPSVIKSTGVFSEGLGSSEKHTTRFSYGRDAESAPTLQKPTIRVKDVIKIDKELEEQKIKSVLGDHVDDEAEEDFKVDKDKDAPIKLPMDDGSCSDKPMATVKVKQEVMVKREPSDDVDCSIATDQKPVVDVKKGIYEDSDVVNVLKNDSPTLILLQLPDSLPGRGGSADDEPAGSSDSKEGKPAESRCRLSDLEEGKVGKLMIHRSGRVRLALGDTIFEVSTGTKAAFHQEVVSLAVDEASRSANLVALGAIKHKLNLLPDWETMFHDMAV